jgi:hypothetical protein
MIARELEEHRKVHARVSPRTDLTKTTDKANRPLDGAEKNLLAEFREREDARHRTPRVRINHSSPNSVEISPAEGEPRIAAMAQLVAFGTTSTDFYSRTFREPLDAGCCHSSSARPEESDVNGALAAMHGIAPRDEIEGMLAAQMVAVHSAAMRSLSQLKGSETFLQQDSNGNLAVKLLRTYVMQLEALQRYRGKGEQKMTVEHVHVYQGGQAIVGAVHQGGRSTRKNGKTTPCTNHRA